ncbi:MAG: hypothetical protein PHY47_00625 [Lachnospiraceae bacterium]|nr:hypothetical protein [Lachnospiraceae bacterium]
MTDSKVAPKKKKKEMNPIVVKYVAPGAILSIGLLLGGMVLQGVYVGLLTTAGFWLLLEKCKEHYPGFYNWMLDHAVEADFVISFLAVFALGMSVTGIIAGAVVNVVGSVVLDYYRDYVGKVDGVESMSLKGIWESCTTRFRSKEEEEEGEIIENTVTPILVEEAA